MKRLAKPISIVFTIVMLVLSLLWMFESNYDYEPIIGVVGCLLALITIIFFEDIKEAVGMNKNVVNSKNVIIGDIKSKGGDIHIGDK